MVFVLVLVTMVATVFAILSSKCVAIDFYRSKVFDKLTTRTHNGWHAYLHIQSAVEDLAHNVYLIRNDIAKK